MKVIVWNNCSRVLRVVLFVTMIFLATGCTGNSDNISNINDKKEEKAVRETEIQSTVNEEIKRNEDECDTSVSSGYCLALGVMDENVVINGSERNESELSIAKGKILFPQGAVRSVCIGSWSRKEESYNPDKNEVDSFINGIENAKIVKKIPKTVFEEMPRIQTKLLVLNSHGEFRTVCLTTYAKGYCEISVLKDDPEDFSQTVSIMSDNGKKKKQVFLQSNEIEKYVKKWIKFEKIENPFDLISKATVLVDEETTSVQLSEEELNLLKNSIKEKKKITVNPCGHDCYFVCTLQDGSAYHFSVCSDGESLSTDQQVYTIGNQNAVKIAGLMKSLLKKL